jgi:hypothetical protein
MDEMYSARNSARGRHQSSRSDSRRAPQGMDRCTGANMLNVVTVRAREKSKLEHANTNTVISILLKMKLKRIAFMLRTSRFDSVRRMCAEKKFTADNAWLQIQFAL